MDTCSPSEEAIGSSQIQIGNMSPPSPVQSMTEPLLQSSSVGDDIPAVAPTRKRLACLDVFRGLTIAAMILADDAGGSWPVINHSPWNGVTMADFVMPFFLFIVGISLVLALKNAPNDRNSILKIILRALKLFLLGLILQGGYFHGTDDLHYGVDIKQIRIMGILQRIGLAYLIVAICEISTKVDSVGENLRAPNHGFAHLLKLYPLHWAIILLLSSIYLGMLYGLTVPNWQFEAFVSGESTSEMLTVNCNVRGDLGPGCNAVGFVDRAVMGINHLYKHPSYIRSKECSTLSPDYGPLPSDAPTWCLAPFDPEGILSSIMAVVSCFIGAHYGHALVQFKGHKRRILEWTTSAFMLLIVGSIINLLGLPLNKPLYTVSYTCITAGAAGLVFSVFYILVDVYDCRHPFILLEWMGMNALLIFVLAACEIFPACVQGFYWQLPENNLVSFVEDGIFQRVIRSTKWSKLAYVLLEILFWCLISGILKINGIFWKL